MFKLLHTSDWHLGRTLYLKKERQEEHNAFLEWLQKTIKEHQIDLLIVAGDIFDTALPSNSSQKIYYDFLLKVHNCGCNNVVIVGGNHDSPSFLNAPKEILAAAFNVYIVGNASENIEDEVIVIYDNSKNPVAIVCAVPFLRERDISRFVEGETYNDRSKRIAESIKKHYETIAEIAENKRNILGKNIPIIATGHLAVAGGKTIGDDGVRDIYIGNIECVGREIFPKIFDYVALGHFHISSVIENNIRYCGSPIPMGFGEAKQKKIVYTAEFESEKIKIESLEIPVFQRLESIIGNKEDIENKLNELKKSNDSVWIEIIYDGVDIFQDFSYWANEKISGSKIEILKLQNKQYLTEVLKIEDNTKPLDELDKFDVFDKLLEKNNISQEQKDELKNSYNEIVIELNTKN